MAAPHGLGDLLELWALGWSISRGFPEPTRLDGGVRVDCALPDRPCEFVATDDGFESLAARAVATPGAWLTVGTADPDVVAERLHASGLTVRESADWFMTVMLGQLEPRPLPEGYDLQVGLDAPDVVVATAQSAAGEVAAGGRMIIVGSDAIADRIETHPEHRRRGLGGAVMTALVEVARDAGAHRGLLAASTSGQHLYAGLGWQRQAHLVVGQVPRAE